MISIVMPVIISDVNYRKMTLDCINSIVQSFSGIDFELIIIDNNSPLPVDFYGPNFKIIRNPENVGISKAWNQGICASSGEIIFFVNNDTLIKGKIDQLLLGFQKYSIVAPTFISNPNEIPGMLKRGVQDFFPGQNGAFFGVKKKLFQTIGVFDEDFSPMYFEDKNFFARAEKAGYKTVLSRDVGCVHLGSQTTNKVAERQLIFDRNRKIFEEKKLNLQPPTINPKITIVMLVYNNPDYTRNSIDSILRNTDYPNWDLIIVDNGSEKETRDILYQYKSEKITIFHSSVNKGFPKGANDAIRISSGDMVVLINNDVYCSRGWLTKLVRASQKFSCVGIVLPLVTRMNNGLATIRMFEGLPRLPIYETLSDSDSLEQLNINLENSVGGTAVKYPPVTPTQQKAPPFFCVLLPKETIGMAGYLDEDFGLGTGEDDVYCHRLSSLGLPIIIAVDCFVAHFGHKTVAKVIPIESPQRKRNVRIRECKMKEIWKSQYQYC